MTFVHTGRSQSEIKYDEELGLWRCAAVFAALLESWLNRGFHKPLGELEDESHRFGGENVSACLSSAHPVTVFAMLLSQLL